MKTLIQAAPVQSSVSWWTKTEVPREGFTKYAEKKEQNRMSAANIKGRVSIPEDWQR